LKAAEEFERLGKALPVRSWLSFKTHPVAPLAHEWLRSGRGIEAVSEFEFAAARAVGATAESLLVNGVAKHTWLHRYDVEHLRVHFDSIREAEALHQQALAQHWRVGIRCHVPDEHDARDSRFGGQFGMTRPEAVHALEWLQSSGLDVRGVHFHLGQGARSLSSCLQSMRYVADVCRGAAFSPEYVDCGGGFRSPEPTHPGTVDLATAIGWAGSHFGARLSEIWLENGRGVTEASAALVVRVVDVKERPDGRYVICDGGRTNQALAADHGLHPLLVLPHRRGPATLTTIAGPTCMTDDILGRVHLPDDIAEGDLIVWMDAGAYHLPWESRFSQGLCAVVWCDAANQLSLARERETPQQWSSQWIPTVT